MRILAGRFASLGALLLASGMVLGQTPEPPRAPAEAMSQQDREVQQLLARLTELSTLITREPNAWQHQVSQADVMLHLAVRTKEKERDNWLRMATDSLYAAALQAPETDTTAYQRLQHLPAQIARTYPDSKVWSHAAWQEIQADYMRMMSKKDVDPAKPQLHLRDRLLTFAKEHPKAIEAPKAVLEAAAICESLGKKDDARRCYAYLAEQYPDTTTARKAAGRGWRMGEGKMEVSLVLPCLYAASAEGPEMYDLKEARGKLVIVYFWSKNCPEVEQDLGVLKQLKEKYRSKGLEIAYVNLDDDGSQARQHLAGKVLPGIHLHQRGGVDSKVAASFGIKALPEAILVGPDGNLIRHSLKANDLHELVASRLPSGGR